MPVPMAATAVIKTFPQIPLAEVVGVVVGVVIVITTDGRRVVGVVVGVVIVITTDGRRPVVCPLRHLSVKGAMPLIDPINLNTNLSNLSSSSSSSSSSRRRRYTWRERASGSHWEKRVRCTV